MKLSYEGHAFDPLYLYRCTPLRVVDGDTVDVDVDLGFHVHRHERIRLAGIDAPELRGEERARGLEAQVALANLLWDQGGYPRPARVWTDKDRRGKWGRFIGVLLVEVDGEMVDVCRWMVEQGHAVPYPENQGT